MTDPSVEHHVLTNVMIPSSQDFSSSNSHLQHVVISHQGQQQQPLEQPQFVVVQNVNGTNSVEFTENVNLLSGGLQHNSVTHAQQAAPMNPVFSSGDPNQPSSSQIINQQLGVTQHMQQQPLPIIAPSSGDGSLPMAPQGKQIQRKSLQGVERLFECKWCQKMFPYMSVLQAHERKHTGEKPFVCDLCGKAFAQKAALTIHERRHSGEKPFVCAYCGKPFVSQGNLKIHERQHTGFKPYSCRECGKQFATNGALKTHEISHFDVKQFNCDLCGRSFAHRTSLYTHKKKHELGILSPTGEIIPTARAGEVGSTQSQQQNFDLQQQQHSIANLLGTSTDPVAGATPDHHGAVVTTPNGHVALPNTAASNILASGGGATEPSTSGTPHSSMASGTPPVGGVPSMEQYDATCGELPQQIIVKTEDGIPTDMPVGLGGTSGDGPRRWECEYCGKRFAFKHPLQTHLRIHTGEKPFKCSYCPKAFAQQTSLIMHHRSHTGERRYGCDTCGRRFIQPAALKAHQRTHTGKCGWVFLLPQGICSTDLTHYAPPLAHGRETLWL